MDKIKREDIQRMYKEEGYSIQEAKSTLIKESANKALIKALSDWNEGYPHSAFNELLEVVTYLVTKVNCRAFIPTDVGHFNPMARGYKHLNSYIE